MVETKVTIYRRDYRKPPILQIVNSSGNTIMQIVLTEENIIALQNVISGTSPSKVTVKMPENLVAALI